MSKIVRVVSTDIAYYVNEIEFEDNEDINENSILMKLRELINKGQSTIVDPTSETLTIIEGYRVTKDRKITR